jgi:uncharacterized protein
MPEPAYTVLLLFLFIIVIIFMSSLGLKLKQILIWQRMPASEITFKSLDKELRFILLYAVFYIIAGYLIGLIILRFPMPILGSKQFIQDAWYSFLYKIGLLLFLPGAVYFFIWKYRFRDVLLGIEPTIKNILSSIIFFFFGFILNASHINSIIQHVSFFDDAPLRIILGIMMPLFVAAIPEELYFRGFLQTRLEKKLDRISSILITNLLFAAWHLPSRYLLSVGVEGMAGDWGQVALHTGLPVFIVGVIFSFHWSRYRNIILLILTHWAIDILPSISAYFKIP